MRLLSLITVLLVGMMWSKTSALSVGEPAPDFKLFDQNGKVHRLSDYHGQWVVVYFYPKDDTPGCTTEACTLRDNSGEFGRRKVVVLGISYDDQASHKTFQEKYNLPFTLLSDTDKKVSDSYGAKGMVFASRKTFVIDPEGVVRKIYEKVDVTSHAADILGELDVLLKG